jgi:hypothetical protein
VAGSTAATHANKNISASKSQASKPIAVHDHENL